MAEDEKIYLGSKDQITEIGDTDTFIIATNDGIRRMTKAQVMEKLGINQLTKELEEDISQLSERMEELTKELEEDISQLSERMEELTKELENDFSQLSEDIANKTGTGLSTEAIDKLEEVGNYLAYTTADGGSKWTELISILRNGSSGGGSSETVPATGITLDKTTLSFTDSTSQTLTATVEPSNSTDSVTWETSDAGVATVSSGVVSPVSNGSCTITAKAGSYSASCEVTVAVETEIVTYTITNKLTNVSTDNPITTITENSGYTAELTADTDYTIDSVTVTMGGTDITSTIYSNGVITIDSVTGDVVITASAVSTASTEEVVLLKSITGDGSSWIDTKFILEDSTHIMELSAKLADPETTTLMGADGYGVGTGYGITYVRNNGAGYLMGGLNGGNFSNVGTWNTTDANSLVVNQFYFVMADGSQKIYLDAEHTKQQNHLSDGSAAYGDAEFVPIPLYLFTANRTDNAHATYTPSDCTIYFFKITDAGGNVVLNLVPAKQGNKIGMYDTVSQKFHENQGTGTFSYEEVSA